MRIMLPILHGVLCKIIVKQISNPEIHKLCKMYTTVTLLVISGRY